MFRGSHPFLRSLEVLSEYSMSRVGAVGPDLKDGFSLPKSLEHWRPAEATVPRERQGAPVEPFSVCSGKTEGKWYSCSNTPSVWEELISHVLSLAWEEDQVAF